MRGTFCTKRERDYSVIVAMPTSESDQSTDLTHPRRIKSAIQVIPENGKKFVPRSPSGSPDSRGSYDREHDVRKRRHDSSVSDVDTDDERRRRKKKKKRNQRSGSSESADDRRSRKGREQRERRRGHDQSRDNDVYDDRSYDRHMQRRRAYERDSDDSRRRRSEVEEARDRGENDDKRENDETKEKEPKKPPVNDILTRAGGAYIPPGRLKMMQQQIEDKNSVEYQRIAWEALKKSLNGLVNKVNVSNIADIVQDMFNENVIRGRGVLCQSLMRAQVASPMFTNVYSALVAIINTKLPKIGELLLRRLILQFRRAFKRNDKTVCMNSARFIAHLVNQNVAHEILGLELLTLLLQNPTNDSVEVAIAFLKEIGQKLTEVSPRGLHAVFERLRNILHEGEIDKRVQYMIEVMFAIRKDGFKDHEPVVKDLDLVEEEDQITHLLRLDEGGQTEDGLNVFKLDPEYQINEDKYKQIKKEIIGGGSSDESSGEDDGDDEDEDAEEEDDEEEAQKKTVDIIDNTETNLVALRRTIYLTIQSSLDYEECAHKMMRMQLKPGQEHEFCLMIIECCAQQRSYEKFFGLLAQRFALLKKEFMEEYVKLFQEQYESIHRLDTNKLRNTAKLFAHLLYSDAIPWTVMQSIKLNEEDTTSSSRIFIKILFQELAEYMGMPKLNERLRDEVLSPFFEGLLPRDNPKNTRFAINFFTAIGLGGLTDDLREHLKNAPKMIMAQAQNVESLDSDSSSSSSDSGSDDSSDSDDSSSDSESSSESEDERKTRKKHKDNRPMKKSHSSKESPPPKTSKEEKRRRRDS